MISSEVFDDVNGKMTLSDVFVDGNGGMTLSELFKDDVPIFPIVDDVVAPLA